MRILACALLLTTVAFADQSCRFTGSYTKSDLMNNLQVREDYLQKVISQEAKFFKEIAFDHKTGLTLEGQRIDEKTGMPSGQPNRYTSASNEAIHLAMLAKTLNGDNNTEMIYSKEEALEIISKKIHTYESFSLAHPEFEGLLPQMHVHHHVEPAQKKASVSENAQVFWAVYGLVDVLQTKYSNELELIQKWKNLETKMLLQINENGGALYEQMMLLHADLPRDQMIQKQKLNLVDNIFMPFFDSEALKNQYEIEQIQKTTSTLSSNAEGNELIDISSIAGVFLTNKPIATVWHHYMISGPAAQTQYGSVDSISKSGKEVSLYLKFETKAVTVLAILGGVSDIVKQRMIKDKIYDKFIQSIENLLLDVISNKVEYTLPQQVSFPSPREDFTSCRLRDFPDDFAFGSATASFQVEGASNTNGRGPSIWDDLCAIKGRIQNGDDGTVADDFYHKYEQDVKMIANLGLKHFRMSLSWSRILPKGTIDQVNQEGVDFYNAVIDTLLAHGIQPWVTLFHWDLPSALQDKTDTGAWLGTKIIGQFNDYADFCFKTFGSKVKRWLTFNEPWTFTWLGYGTGGNAPGRCTQGVIRDDCDSVGGGGNTGTEPYIVTHTVILAHGTAVKTYRDKYQKDQGGQIGWTLNTNYGAPFNSSNPDDFKAIDVSVQFAFGWYMDPIVFGKYPDVMVQNVGDRLPKFTDEQVKLIQGSYDFIGLNHYTSSYLKFDTTIEKKDWGSDSQVAGNVYNASGHLIGPKSESGWLYVYPEGLRGLLNWIDQRYSSPNKKQSICIFENGVSVPDENKLSIADAVHDVFRVNYYKGYLQNVKDAVTLDGVKVTAYFAWSLMDNFEWADGYSVRFGMTYVDYKNNQARYLKDSAFWYSQFVKTQQINGDYYNPVFETLKSLEKKEAKFLEFQE